eukprot:g2787.t1
MVSKAEKKRMRRMREMKHQKIAQKVVIGKDDESNAAEDKCDSVVKLADDLAAMCSEKAFALEVDEMETKPTILQNKSLKAKLKLLHNLAEKGKSAIDEFVSHFVPKDLDKEDLVFYTEKLKSGEKVGRNGESEWDFLVAEIGAIANGRKISHIDGDYPETDCITFTFEHPIEKRCDRQVTFIRGDDNDWRADA